MRLDEAALLKKKERYVNILPDRENRAADNDLLTNKMMVALCIACMDLMLVMGIRWGYSASGAFPFFYTAT